jgi:chemotaxis regulatin CheY-phosphate phosphatase CheZ
MACADPDPGLSSDDAPGAHRPVTPHATPIVDAEGRLTYVGDDGRRYVVGLPADADEQAVEQVMQALRRGGTLFQDIETLCRRWLEAVSGEELDDRSALALLLTTLETALEDEEAAESDGDDLI